MLASTYQHDFITPHTKRYEFLKGQVTEKIVKESCECQGIEENKPDAHKKVEKQYTVEWSGIAPMGRLIDPRIIPTKLLPEQLDATATDGQEDCFEEQPNRYLKTLRTDYPDLYDRLQQVPKDKFNSLLERQRMYTTYQIDFCNINEYAEGVYKSLEDETSKSHANNLLKIQGPCPTIRYNVTPEPAKEPTDVRNNCQNPCKRAYKPFKISFADSTRFINSGNSSHWRSNIFNKKVKFSEYMDTINKIGCVIMKNNIHDHQKCTGKHCRHQLVHACTNTKLSNVK